MTNEQIVSKLNDINDRLRRNLKIVFAHLEAIETVSQAPHSCMHDAIDGLYTAAHDVLLLKDTIAAKQELETSNE